MSNINEKSYDKIAQDFVLERQLSEIPDLVIKFCGLLKENDIVLDIGCGGGVPIDKYLSEKGIKITGIDISIELLEEAQKSVPKAEFIKSDIVEYETGKKFDGIVAWDSLFHLEYNQQQEIFKKVDNLLKKGGYFVFTHGGSEGEIEGEMYGEKFFYSSLGPNKMKALLEQLDFEIIDWIIDNSEENGYMMALVKKL